MARPLSWLVVAGLAGAALIGPGASGALATSGTPSVQPIPHEGNITECSQGTTIFINGNSGTGDDSGSAGGVTVNVHFDADNTLDWNSVGGTVSIVYVKGGDAYNEYDYSPAATSDTGLAAPLNGGENVPDISHAVFCVNPTETTTTSSSSESTTESSTESTTESSTESSTTSTTESSTESTTQTSTVSSTESSTESTTESTTQSSTVSGTTSEEASPSGDVLGAEGTPNVTLPPTSTLDATTTSGSPDAIRIILLGLAVLIASILLLQPKGSSTRK
jgi:hypothetical protein